MPDSLNRRDEKFAKYDAMSTDELQQILRDDASNSEGAESDTETLFYVMEVLAKRRQARNEGKSPEEALESFKQNYYTENDTFRSTNTDENVVSVGKVIADELNKAGIVTIHDTVMYDEASYNSAYTNSRNAVKKWLAAYPSIKCVIDVHRDAIVTADGKNIKPLVNIVP